VLLDLRRVGSVREMIFAHQEVGARRIEAEPYIWIADEMGAGKTVQPIVAAERLFQAGVIENAVVVAPAQCYKEIWSDKDLGQIAQFSQTPVRVYEHRPKPRSWTRGDGPALDWVVTNYELVRNKRWMVPLLERVGEKTLLVLDESIHVSSPSAATTKAIYQLRKKCGRVVLLNGTEGGGDTPAALYAQCKIMSPDVLNCKTWYEFRARYAVMGGFMTLQWIVDPITGVRSKRMAPVQIKSWVNLDDLWSRVRPHYLRRLKTECLDLPPKLPPVSIGVELTKATWKIYKEMRDDSLAYIDKGLATANHAAVRALRLAQITSGFSGGVQDINDEGLPYGSPQVREIGTEKLDAFVAWVSERTSQDSCPKIATWCRFRAEAERSARALARVLGPARVGLIIGGQTDAERGASIRLLDPRFAPDGPAVTIGTTRAGAYGINQAAADKVAWQSNEYSHVARSQSADRPHRPGQTNPVGYFDFVASGPDGQKTIDHQIAKALRNKQNIASWSARDWYDAIAAEE
jgi:hypothetical protein